MVTKWQFWDPIASETYVFPINPNAGGTPTRAKSLAIEKTAAPDGKAILFEGREDPRKISVSGAILEEAELNAFYAWYDKRHQVRLTDDLGRQFWVYITNFSATRDRRQSHPWHHSYQMEMTILDQ